MLRHIYQAPCGELILEVDSGKVVSCIWNTADAEESSEEASVEDFKVMRLFTYQLHEYFSGKRNSFELPLMIGGTPFRCKVWECLRDIPYGHTMTYGEIAERCGCRGGQRAVAQACGANRLAILVPCHRVVSSDGTLGGYTVAKEGTQKGKRPEGLAIKQYLLSHEAGCSGMFINPCCCKL